ncbi:hypothetical protein DFH11DRAFT_1591873, partial [Phellopilus nigrolimitatus]
EQQNPLSADVVPCDVIEAATLGIGLVLTALIPIVRMVSRIHSYGKLADSSVYFALTNTGKTGIYFSGDADYKPVFFYCAQPSTGGAGGCLTGCMVGMGETDKAFEHAGFQLRSTINLHETPPSAIDLRAFRQIANKWGFDNIEKGVECAAPAKWLAAYLSILFHVPVKHSRRG